jgi:hypothetical protein
VEHGAHVLILHHPAIFQLVGGRKDGALADYESQLGAKRYLSAVEVFMKLNTIDPADSSECLRAIAELSQVHAAMKKWRTVM